MWRSLITVLCATGTVLCYEPRSISVLQNSENSIQANEKRSDKPEASGCPNGFVPLGSKDCYYLSTEVDSWLNAHFWCASKNAKLAELSEMKMNKELKKYLTYEQSNHVERWIGAKYNWGTKAWEWGITGSNYTYDGFGKSNSGSDRVDKEWHCVVMNPERKYDWTARSCSDIKHFVCHKERNLTGSGTVAEIREVVVPPTEVQPNPACPEGFVLLGKRNCFYISPGVANWLDAEYFCQDRKAMLAELPKKHLNRKLKKYLMSLRSTGFERWIGAKYNRENRVWEWGITGRNMTYEGFSKLKSETDRVDEQWHCAVMNPERKYNWAARSCVEEKHYICHKRARLPNKTGKKDRISPNVQRRQRIKNRTNIKGRLSPNSEERNEILPFRKYRTSKRSGPAWSSEMQPRKDSKSILTRWAPGTKHSDRLKPVKSKDPALPELWVGRKKAEAMTLDGNFVKVKEEELLPKPTSPAGVPPTLPDSIETETTNMLTQFGGHMFV